MKNVVCKVEGDILHIAVNLKAEGEQSKSGKSTVLATTEGNVSVPGTANLKFGLTVYEPKAKAA